MHVCLSCTRGPVGIQGRLDQTFRARLAWIQPSADSAPETFSNRRDARPERTINVRIPVNRAAGFRVSGDAGHCLWRGFSFA